MQEDPIGIAGGVNLYLYAGNNPAMLTDPFGLKVCFEGDEAEVRELASAVANLTNTKLTIHENCITEIESRGNKAFYRIRDILEQLASSKKMYTLSFSDEDSYYDPATRTAFVLRSDPAHTQYDVCGGGRATFSLEAIVGHELIGHGGSSASERRFFPETWGRKAENWYHAAAAESKRCGTSIYR